MRSLEVLALGIIIAAAPGVQAQSKPASAAPAKPAATTAAKSAPQSAKPSGAAPAAKPQAAKPASAAPAGKPQAAAPPSAKAAAKAPAKPAAKTAVKSAPKKPVEKPASTEVAAGGAGEGEAAKTGTRRDPFESLVSRQQNQANKDKLLPPGKAGLQVSTLRLDGIVKAPNGMIAVVTNPQARTYFLREGDQLYDGRVEKIAMDGVSFHELGKDAFGKPVERQVNKRIYSSTPGEQQ